MGVIIKYQVHFPEADVKVSNDPLGGGFILDADITVEMLRGAAGCKFDVKLYDLPETKAKKLFDKLKKLRATIKLGYFDGDFESVIEGVVKTVRCAVEGDKLVTSVTGVESGTNALRETRFKDFQSTLAGAASLEGAVKEFMKRANEGVDKTPKFFNVPQAEGLLHRRPRGENLLEVLDELAETAKVELLVCDKQVRMGRPITDDKYETELARDKNLASFQPFIKEIPDEAGRNRLKPLQATQAQGFEFTITGDPKLRPAHKVVPKLKAANAVAAGIVALFGGAEDFGDMKGMEFRVHSLKHQLSVTSGYVCKGVAMKVCTDDNCRRQETSAQQPSADAVARSLSQKTQAAQRNRPAVEIGQVKSYDAGAATGGEKHLASVYFTQRFDEAETQPSVRAEVDADEGQLFLHKPLVSPFAWHKCGLVVPVYPGMKALLTHNLSLPDDALVTGFIWSAKPAIEPPRNKEGDWWLCLPIDFDVTKPPPDGTKAANDLTANNGKRVIGVKGLKITVGGDKLQNVGARPEEGADDEFLIEHKSGTRLHIAADGTLTIEARTISIKGDVTVEGNVEIK